MTTKQVAEASNHQASTSDAIAGWRRTILDRALWTAFLIVLCATAAVLIQQPSSGVLLAERLLPGELVLAATLAWRRGPTSIRATALIVGFAAVIAGAALDRGFQLPNVMGSGLLMTVLSALIVGRRAAWATVTGLLLLWGLVGLLFIAGRASPADTYTDLSLAGNWMRILGVYSAIVIATTGSVMFIVTRLENALRRGDALYEALSQEVEQKLDAQRQLQQAQKLESLGRLAGEVAHDFNNLLLVILCNAEALVGLDEQERVEAHRDIVAAAQRATTLTRQLLGFSRQHGLEVGALDVETSTSAALALLRRLMPDSIAVHVDLAPSLPSCWGPVTAVEQILMNLCVNARDAMPSGGELFVSATQVRRVPPDDSGHTEGAKEYVRLSVRDTGTGMDERTLHHVFEPFFTTKEAGRGTGLGLSMVQGLAQHCGGFAEVQSKLGEGTSFDVYLAPSRHDATSAESDGSLAEGVDVRGASETNVLVVDDDESVRRVLRHATARAIPSPGGTRWPRWSRRFRGARSHRLGGHGRRDAAHGRRSHGCPHGRGEAGHGVSGVQRVHRRDVRCGLLRRPPTHVPTQTLPPAGARRGSRPAAGPIEVAADSTR